jgi:chromosome segregation ATPase
MSPASPAPLSPGSTPFADPHLRGVPTVTGKHWELAPWETPTDRLAELTAKLETVLAQNTALLARAKELETLGASREQALLEAMREIESVNAAAAQEKAALLAQVTALQKRLQQLEDDEIRFLEAVLEGLRKLLPPEKKP